MYPHNMLIQYTTSQLYASYVPFSCHEMFLVSRESEPMLKVAIEHEKSPEHGRFSTTGSSIKIVLIMVNNTY